jgi:hypothetical protein
MIIGIHKLSQISFNFKIQLHEFHHFKEFVKLKQLHFRVNWCKSYPFFLKLFLNLVRGK